GNGRLTIPPWLHSAVSLDCARRLLWHRLELVADAVAGLDERVARRSMVDLLAQAADADVDGAVAVGRAAAPDPLQQLISACDPALVQRKGVEQTELRRRQACVL